MYTVRSIEIEGFWHRHSVKVDFNDDVNVVIGRNGTGKTTFMNILQGVLAVDLDLIAENHFDSATIVLLNDEGNRRTVKATKFDNADSPFSYIEYRISTKKYPPVVVAAEDPARSAMYRRRYVEVAEEVRGAISELLSLASLSVYRMRREAENDARERGSKGRYFSPVDLRLTELTQLLTSYQLEVSQQAQDVAKKLQKEVLTSLLYEKEKSPRHVPINFNAENEKRALTLAYSQLDVTGPSITKRINEHVTSIEKAVSDLVHSRHDNVDFAALEAKLRTDKVVKASLEAAQETDAIYSQVNRFLEEVRSFITDKKFSLIKGELRVDAASGPLSLDKLSSGEKQLLILMIEAVLQRQRPYVFLADEPELSLHIAWQKRIVPAVRRLNPHAQIIVATHSPEVAGRYRDALIDMEDMIHGRA